MEFSRHEYWSGCPFPSPGNLPNPGIELKSPTMQADSLPSEPPGKPKFLLAKSLFFFFFLCSREVWPERDVFGAQDISPEEEIQLLKQILWAPLPRESPFPSHHSPSHASLAPTSQIPGNPHSFCRPAGAGGTRGRGRRRRRGGGGRVRSGPGVGERI